MVGVIIKKDVYFFIIIDYIYKLKICIWFGKIWDLVSSIYY